MQNLSGARKAAILIMALGEESSASVFKHLQESEIEQIVREVASLGQVPPEVGEQVLDEFNQMAAVYIHE
ncbi:MAG: flagellar motor switch protein FliG, partial [Acidobacteriota bacterium]